MHFVKNLRDADNFARVAAAVIDEREVALFHHAHVIARRVIAHAVPFAEAAAFVIAHKIVPRKCGGFSF